MFSIRNYLCRVQNANTKIFLVALLDTVQADRDNKGFYYDGRKIQLKNIY